MKIVVPVDNDKSTIFKRTGRTPFFNIYEGRKLLESVPNNHSHGDGSGHKDGHEHKKDIEALKGCDIILVQALGENMSEALESINLKVMKLRKDDGSMSEEVVDKYLNNNLVNQIKVSRG